VGEILAADTVLAKAASICRYAVYAKQAAANIVAAQLRAAQLN
jgi:hypothetical protein